MSSTGKRLAWGLLLVLMLSAERAWAYYDPGVQRWLNRDPVRDLGFAALHARRAGISVAESSPGVSLFAFVQNAPTEKLDAFGLQTAKPPVTSPPLWIPSFPTGGGVTAGNPGTLGGRNSGTFPDFCPARANNPCTTPEAIRNLTPTTTDGDIQCFKFERCEFNGLGVGGVVTYGWNWHTRCVLLTDGPVT